MMIDLKNLFYTVILVLLTYSCSNDDDRFNKGAPVIKAQIFSSSESVADTEVIGIVKAEDPNGDALTFKMGADRSGLFELSEAGAISLIDGETLDFETSTEHEFTVSVTDGRGIYYALITIKVLDVDEPNIIENTPPTIDSQTFEVSEDIADTDIIGIIQASDQENDDLFFTKETDDSSLFELLVGGELSLAPGKSLDFNMSAEHTLIVNVSDGNGGASQATISIDVTEGITMNPQSFEVAETISDNFVIGTIVATDPENDALTFAFVANENDLFEISESGELSLADGKNLDAETNVEHTITVSATDNGDSGTEETQITIHVIDRYESTNEDPEWFVTTWNPNNVFGMTVQIVVDTQYTYDFMVDWGDDTIEQLDEFSSDHEFFNGSSSFEHTYLAEDAYTVAIKGAFPYFSAIASPVLIRTIDQWGEIGWESFESSFANCSFLTYNATDVPDLSRVKNMSSMFESATAFNGDISTWDTTNVTKMESMFRDASAFEGASLGQWTVDNVTKMAYMFSGASSFYGDISGWNVSRVADMEYMLSGASSFNAPIGIWDVGRVSNMEGMLNSAANFNRDLGTWNLRFVFNVVNMLSDSGLSPTNYSATLTGWVNNPNTQDSLTLDAIGLNYCNTMQTLDAVDELINVKGWTITDDGPTACP